MLIELQLVKRLYLFLNCLRWTRFSSCAILIRCGSFAVSTLELSVPRANVGMRIQNLFFAFLPYYDYVLLPFCEFMSFFNHKIKMLFVGLFVSKICLG